MLTKKYILVILVFLVFSCSSKEINGIKPESETESESESGDSFADIRTEDERNNRFIDINTLPNELKIKILLLSQEEYSIASDGFITILNMENANFGIPDGDNWLVEWGRVYYDTYRKYTTNLVLYAIKDTTIVKRFDLGLNFNWRDYSQYDITGGMGSGSGRTWNGSGTTRYSTNFLIDNEKNVVEIQGKQVFTRGAFDPSFFNFGRISFGGRATTFEIFGYDKETDEIITYLEVPTTVLDRLEGPSPVSVYWYNGVWGVKVYRFHTNVAGGPGEVREPILGNGWVFYVWNGEQRQFLESEEIIDE